MRNTYTNVLLLFFCSLFLSTSLTGQDARFAQFYYTPLQLNPALTGVFDGQFRATVNYRSLYESVLGANPYRTFAAGLDMRYNVFKYDYVGFGVSALRDEVGVSGFNRTSFNVSTSYQKKIGGKNRRSNQFLVAGAQIGVGQRAYTWEPLWFTEQFNTMGNYAVDYGANNGEVFADKETNFYLDFNAGVLWYATFGKNKSFYLGGAIQHVNKPNISFLSDNNERLPSKYVIHTGGEFPIGDNVSLLPAAAVLMQNPSFSTTVGANLRYSRRDWKEVAIRAGLWGHIANKLEKDVHLDAVTVSAIIEVERMNIGLSYDITASILSHANDSRGAFEVSFIYVNKPKRRRGRVICPRF